MRPSGSGSAPGEAPRPAARGAARLARALGRWPIALAACLLLAAAVLVPGLDQAGLWEPQERAFADRVAPPRDVEAERAARQLTQSAQGIVDLARPQAPPPGAQATALGKPPPCERSAPSGALARSLTTRAVQAGRDHISDDDHGRRLPLALLGLVTVLATAGIAMRLAGPRAGALAAIALLAMPLLVLQSRLLLSELGTACGASLILYGLVALARPWRARGLPGAALDGLLSTIALAAGVAIGFLGGGALLGLLVPIGAFAVAGGLGAPALAAAAQRRPFAAHLPALAAGLAAAGLAALLAWQIYDLTDPYPGIVPPARQALGRAIVVDGCWSWALGGVWRPDDDLRYIFDSTFEQIAYGTFPWGVLAPLAMAALLGDRDAGRRGAGALALAWAGAAWIATEVFQRKVGIAIWAGFPALAIAVGAWLDGVLARRARLADGDPAAMPAGALLIGLFFLIATIALGKDMFSFAEKVTSLLTGADPVAYPKPSTLLGVPTRLWPLLLGGLAALGVALSLMTWRAGGDPSARLGRRIAGWGTAGALAATAAAAAFWAFAWHPELSHYLSSRTIFETYRELRAPGDALVIMGDVSFAPRAYADACPVPPPAIAPPPAPGTPAAPPAAPPPPAPPGCQDRPLEIVQTREQIVSALKRPRRVFAVAPQGELCTLHREIGEQPYFVLEERNLRSILLSNRVDGAIDRNPLADVIVHAEPRAIPGRPPRRMVFDGKIELLGWALPATITRGERFDVVLYYKILQPVGAAWKVLMHFDGAGGRAGNADHEPIDGRCSTATWQPGDYIIDRFTGVAGTSAYPAGRIEIWTGFFTGSSPTFRNMPVSEAPAELRDPNDRIKIATLPLD